MASAPQRAREAAAAPAGVGDAYARYVLGVLTLVYVLNFLDRNILSILAERIKADLGLGDDQLGFLYGTAFAVFYAVFGIPLGRLADGWNRRSLIAIGLAFWSAMTAASGLARDFVRLAVLRVGVGVGEASATPAAYSMLCDYFPSRVRATVLALYSSGIYLGAGLGLGIGGLIVERWDAAFGGTQAPFGLRGWQVAFLVVGSPGLLLALWVRSLREPVRGAAEGVPVPVDPHPFRAFLRELVAVLPPLTLVNLHQAGAGARGLARNGAAAAVLAALAAALIFWLGSPPQWIALALGCYAAFSWAQALALRDAEGFAHIFRTPSLRHAALCFGLLAFTGYGLGFWIPPFFVRLHGVSEAQVGSIVGGTAALAGWLGVVLGGVLGDRWRTSSPNGRLHVCLLTALLPVPLSFWMLTTPSTATAYVLNFPVTLLVSMWIGCGASTVQDLVPPRLRATASAAYLLVLTFVGLALGPYTIGRLSLALGDLRQAMLCGLLVNLAAVAFALGAMRHLARDEARLRGEVT
jgi:MFS family permease